MDVTCNRCCTVYEFDAGLIAPTGTTVKCTECGHLFKVHRPMVPPPPTGGPDDAPSRPRSWRVRQSDGSSRVVESLAEVIRLIGAGQVGPDDEISRTGQVWKRLGTIAELTPLFGASERAQRRSEPHALAASEGPPLRRDAEAAPSSARERRPSPREHELGSTQAAPRVRRPSPVVELSAPRRVATLPPPAPSISPVELPAGPALHAPLIAPQTPVRTLRHYAGLVSIAGVLFFSVSVAAVMLAPAPTRNVPLVEGSLERLLSEADQALASHRPSGFALAIADYERALRLDADDAQTLSAVSRAHAIWSQWLRARLGPPERSDQLLASEATELKSQAHQHALEAHRYAQRAVQLSPARGSVGLAWSDALRLSGDLEGARAALDHARVAAGPSRSEALRVAALLAIDESGGDASAGRALAEQAVAAEPDSLRTRFLLLHCLIGSSAFDAARLQLRSLRELDPTHPSLPALAAQIDAAGQEEQGQKPREGVTPHRDRTASPPSGADNHRRISMLCRRS